MKEFETNDLIQKANLIDIKEIIENLFSENSQEWLCLYDNSIKNSDYIQTHSDIFDLEDDALNFLNKNLQIPLEKFDEIENIYLLEFRKYHNKKKYNHYRAFFTDANIVYSYFEKYMNDEEIDISNWYDVTDEFQ